VCTLDGYCISFPSSRLARIPELGVARDRTRDTLFTIPPRLRTLILLPSLRFGASPSDKIDKSKEVVDPTDGAVS
jgi:hypothetical protein